MVSVIIPAYNEEETIREVVGSVIGTPQIEEVIVVDDGSTDRTAAVATAAGARVISKKENVGKAQALSAGVSASRGDILLFLDADVAGLTKEKIAHILQPVIAGQYSMFVGLRERRTYWLNKVLHFFPIIGGERALTRQLWNIVPAQYKERFQIEIALNYFSKRLTNDMGFSLISGLRHVTKEHKRGLIKGFAARLAMVKDILKVSFQLYIIRPIVELSHAWR